MCSALHIFNVIVFLCRTDGEEGAIKVWSKTGMLRTVLVQSG